MNQSTSMYKHWWVDRFERNREYYEDAVDVSSNWEVSSQSEHLLINALRAAYADAPNAIVNKFASKAISIVVHAAASNGFENGKLTQSAFPRNRAVALRASSYAHVLLGDPLPADDLLQASRDFEARAASSWNHQYEAYYLNGVRAAILAGNQERFSSLLNTQLKFKCHEEEYISLRGIADELPHSSSSLSTDLRDRFRALFDCYRNPEFKPNIYIELEIVRFELAAIWCRFFNKSRAFSWQEVINTVSE